MSRPPHVSGTPQDDVRRPFARREAFRLHGSLDGGHGVCSDVRAMEQTFPVVDRVDATPSRPDTSLPRTVTPVSAPTADDDLRLALELADIGADLASEFGSQPNTESTELRRQILRLRERVQCPRTGRTPTMHFMRKP